MGALTVQNIIDRVRNQFGDANGAQVTDAMVINWINDGMREIVVQNDLLQVTGSSNSVANQVEYSLPAGILRMRRVAYSGQTLRPITLEEADELIPSHASVVGGVAGTNYPTGTPTHYWIWSGKISFFPAPDTANVALTLYYTRYPTAVEATGDTPELPAEYDNRIVEYCLAQAFELDMNTTMMQVKGGQFQQGVDKLKGEDDWENQEFYPNITMIPEYDNDIVGWY